MPSIEYSHAPLPVEPVIAIPPITAPVSASVIPVTKVFNVTSMPLSSSVVPIPGLAGVRMGASFTDVTVSVAMSVDELNAVVPPLFAPAVSTCWPTVPLVVSQPR